VRSQLRTLSKLAADSVARHLVAAGRLVDEDPQAALEQARAARALGARVAVVREAVGETAYAAGEWAEAIAELRTARRMTGDDSALPMIADSERALGRADRALRLAQSEEARALGPAERAEMRIVEAGARRDLGQLDAALLTLQDLGLDQGSVQPWSARVWYAYADLLLAAGREDEARDWFLAAAGADPDGATDADERLLELDGIEILTDEDEDGSADDEDVAANLTDDIGEDAIGDEAIDGEPEAAGASGDLAQNPAEVTVPDDVEPEVVAAAGDSGVDAAEVSLTEDRAGDGVSDGAEPEAAAAAGDSAGEQASLADGAEPDVAADPAENATGDDVAADGSTQPPTEDDITEDDLADTAVDDESAEVPEPGAADTFSSVPPDTEGPEVQPAPPVTLTFSDQDDQSGSSE
jgi:tetratricopeptide (TPR) repeat protein